MRLRSRVAGLAQLAFDFFANPTPPPHPVPNPGAGLGLRPASAPPIPSGEDGLRQRYLSLPGLKLSYRLQRGRRHTIGLTIEDDGLRVLAPRWSSMAEIERVIADKASWVERCLRQQRDWRELASRTVVWRINGTIPYLGAPLQLRQSAGGTMYHQNETLYLDLPVEAHAQQVKDRVQGWLQSQATSYLPPEVGHFCQRLGIDYAQVAVKLSAAKSYWGNCSADRVIRLNWRLMHLAPELIRHVVAHEVCHLREMNHSKAFWQLLGMLDAQCPVHVERLKKTRLQQFF